MLALGLAMGVANAQTSGTTNPYKGIDEFNDTNGSLPIGKLTEDSAGNLYGVTAHGGNFTSSLCSQNYGCGTVYELSPVAGGGWKNTLLYTFGGEADGGLPLAGLTIDSAGNLYGTTWEGGSCSFTDGCGVVFELSNSGGGWKYQVIYTFQGLPDGYSPMSTLTLDKAGNVYGTTSAGGKYYGGTVFEVSPGTGGWTEKLIYEFSSGTNNQGNNPEGGVIFDAAGNLYGTTMGGGNYGGICSNGGCGTVFELSSNGSGGWTKSLIFRFNGPDGYVPAGDFVSDSSGNLYGITMAGGKLHPVCGSSGCGVVYELARNGGSGWSEKVLLDLPNTVGGFYSGPAIDAAGNLYASVYTGGSGQYGFAFKLTKGSSGNWTTNTLHNFTGVSDGEYPDGGWIVKPSGVLIGTAAAGGIVAGSCSNGCGLVYEITQ
jgi:hypothetical protein